MAADFNAVPPRLIALRAVLEEARRGDIEAQVVDVQPRDRRLVDGVVDAARSV